jgi:hypothetical protein
VWRHLAQRPEDERSQRLNTWRLLVTTRRCRHVARGLVRRATLALRRRIFPMSTLTLRLSGPAARGVRVQPGAEPPGIRLTESE